MEPNQPDQAGARGKPALGGEETLALLASIVNNSDDAIIGMTPEGTIVCWNQGAERIYGYSAHEAIGKPMAVFVPPDRREELKQVGEKVKRGERVAHFETVRLRKDGQPLQVSLTVSPIISAQGRLTGISAIARDITQRNQTEQALQVSQQMAERQLAELNTLYEQAPVGLCFLDKDMRYVRINQRLAEMNGRPVAEHLGRTVREIVPELADKVEPFLQQVLVTNTPVQEHEIHGPSPKGLSVEQHWLVSYYPVKNDIMWGVNCMVLENTERKQTENALRQAREQQRHYAHDLEREVSERTAQLNASLQAMEGVSYHLAHDLRAPLRTIQGFASVLMAANAASLDDRAKDYLQQIATATNRMDRLIQDLMTYGKLSHANWPMEWVRLEALVTALLAQLAEEIKAVNAVVDVVRPLPMVQANATLLQQILTNLLGNALKYVARGVAPHVRIWVETDVNIARLYVQDNGIGIAPEHQEKIFRAFERLHSANEYPGTGLGLSIVQKAVQCLGGKVWLQSQLGHGSCFCVEWPKEQRQP